MLTVHADDREFSLRAVGEELYYLPNILLEAHPIISVRLHDLAMDSERGSEWIFNAVQKKFGKTGLKGVKCGIWRRGGPKKLHMNFRLPLASLCRDLNEFHALLSFYGGHLMTVHCPTRADPNRQLPTLEPISARSALNTMSEQEILAMFNERRRQKLREMEQARPKRSIRDHNKWASTEAHMESIKQRMGETYG